MLQPLLMQLGSSRLIPLPVFLLPYQIFLQMDIKQSLLAQPTALLAVIKACSILLHLLVSCC